MAHWFRNIVLSGLTCFFIVSFYQNAQCQTQVQVKSENSKNSQISLLEQIILKLSSSVTFPLGIEQKKQLLQDRTLEYREAHWKYIAYYDPLDEHCYLTCSSNDSDGFTIKKTIQIRLFSTQSGTLVLCSEEIERKDNQTQSGMRIFDFVEDSLVENNSNLLPASLDVNGCFAESTPDSIKVNWKDYFTTYYQMQPIYYGIEYRVVRKKPEFDKWLKNYGVRYLWNGKSFDQEIIEKTAWRR